jgi:acyl carrier protein
LTDEIADLVIGIASDIAKDQELGVQETITENTRLFGPGGVLDSMALVGLVVALEQAIEDRYGVTVPLADEKALSQRDSPYRSVTSLAVYAKQELEARRRNG